MWAFSLFVRNFASLLNFLFPFLEKPSKVLPEQLMSMVSLVSRTGRHLQRFDQHKGYRLVVGCIPYRYRKAEQPSSIDETSIEDLLEILVISAQKGQAMLFPKGGWEEDESMEDAALRETIEEAGVMGNVECKLGPWIYMSKRGGIMHEGYMFPLLVKKELDIWPEQNIRKRKWVTIKEAREVCQKGWMTDALEELVRRQTQLHQQRKERK